MGRRSSSKNVDGILILLALIMSVIVAALQAIADFLHKYWLFIAALAAAMLFFWLLSKLFSKPGRQFNRISPNKTDRATQKAKCRFSHCIG